MATTKVGIYRSYYGPVPRDSSGQPLPESEWLKKRPFSWVVRWFGSDGNRYSKSFRTRKEAEHFTEIKQAEVREGRGDPPEEITLTNFVNEHEQVMNGQVASETLQDQMRALRIFKAHVGGGMSLGEIRPRQAESFVAMRLSLGAKVATVNKDIRTLKRVFNLAINPRGYLPPGENPFGGIKQRKQSAKSIRYVTSEEYQKLQSAASPTWWKTLFTGAYTTGARLNEILNLTWSDVDFAQNRIRIASKEAGDTLAGWEPKDHEGRILPVPVEVMQLLADLQTEAPEGCPYVFVPGWRWDCIQKSRKAGTWQDEQRLVNNLNRRLETLRKRAGVGKLTYHDLRRSCLTNWASPDSHGVPVG